MYNVYYLQAELVAIAPRRGVRSESAPTANPAQQCTRKRYWCLAAYKDTWGCEREPGRIWVEKEAGAWLSDIATRMQHRTHTRASSNPQAHVQRMNLHESRPWHVSAQQQCASGKSRVRKGGAMLAVHRQADPSTRSRCRPSMLLCHWQNVLLIPKQCPSSVHCLGYIPA